MSHWLFREMFKPPTRFPPEAKSFLLGISASITATLLINYIIKPSPSARLLRKLHQTPTQSRCVPCEYWARTLHYRKN